MKLFPRKRARIVEDSYAGYEVQCWRWWFPFWIQAHDGGLICNTHSTIEQAEAFAKRCLRQMVVKEVTDTASGRAQRTNTNNED